MMDQAIEQFATQFAYTPEIMQVAALQKKSKAIVCGMGGSHLAADIIAALNPALRIHVHSDYDLPAWDAEQLQESLVILSSYSGNTEEVLSAYKLALQRGLAMAVVAVGGQLIQWAKADGIAYVQLPDTGIQPRSALGYSMLGTIALLGETTLLEQAQQLAQQLDPQSYKAAGQQLADEIRGTIPCIYASRKNQAIAYNWKIKCNETGKIPAFYNVFPELNHNEMTGFDVEQTTTELSNNITVIFLTDASDHPRVQARMRITKSLYEQQGLRTKELPIAGTSPMQGLYASLLLADWFAYFTSQGYGLESEQVPMVEDFKKQLATTNES